MVKGYCMKCGAGLPIEALFCPKCGAPAKAPTTVSMPVKAIHPPTPARAAEMQNKIRKYRRTSLSIFLCSLFAVLFTILLEGIGYTGIWIGVGIFQIFVLFPAAAHFSHRAEKLKRELEGRAQHLGKSTRKTTLLAIVPGLFGILGVGHLYLHRFAVGILFLLLGIIFGVVLPIAGMKSPWQAAVALQGVLFSILIYTVLWVVQVIDASRLAKRGAWQRSAAPIAEAK